MEQQFDTWLNIEDHFHHAVVQVFASIAPFDWLEPYRVPEYQESIGTGFFIDARGYLLTSAHVVDEARSVWIQMPILGRKTIAATMVSICMDRDVALLKIYDEDVALITQTIGTFPALSLGDSDTIKRTQQVLVLGYPLGDYHLKTTTGVVSGRELLNGITTLQITAPVTAGNSGGPVVTADGKVVGITLAVLLDVSGAGFAMPINEINHILEEMHHVPLVRKPFLGAQFHNANDALAEYLGNPLPAGFYVQKIYPGFPLDKAGVKERDMIYEINGVRIDDCGFAHVVWSDELVSVRDLISRFSLGETIHFKVYRQGKLLELSAVYDNFPLYPVRQVYPIAEPIDYEVVGGVLLMELTENHIPLFPMLASYNDVEKKLQPALVITYLFQGSQGAQLGCLVPGDTIKEINGSPVRTLGELRVTLLASLDKKFLTILTNNDIFAVFNFASLVQDEARLAQDFSYELSPCMIQLLQIFEHKDEKKN